MRWETAEPPGAGDARSSEDARAQQPLRAPGEEHVGPLSFTRESKDDGRMLILYRRDGEHRDG
jgi:hypothetical protein